MLNRTKGILSLLATIAFGISVPSATHSEPLKPEISRLANTQPERVLFVGNSYLYYNDSLHNHVRRMLSELLTPSSKLQFKSSTIGGARLSHHNLPHLLAPHALGIEKPFELVILQGGSSEPLTENSDQKFQSTIDLLTEQSNQAGAEVALYMTHAYVAPHPKADPSLFDSIYQSYVRAGNRTSTLVIPVGLAFEKSYSQRPDLALHKFFDGTHPNIYGTYLAACTVIASVYRISPMVEYDAYGEITKEDARYLQQIAIETVEEFYAHTTD